MFTLFIAKPVSVRLALKPLKTQQPLVHFIIFYVINYKLNSLKMRLEHPRACSCHFVAFSLNCINAIPRDFIEIISSRTGESNQCSVILRASTVVGRESLLPSVADGTLLPIGLIVSGP